MTRNRHKLIDFFLIAVLALGMGGCAIKGARHVATVTAVSAHATLAAIQDTATLLVCGRPSAPAPPACVPPDVHQHTLAPELAKAFDADAALARAVRDWPQGAAPPATIAERLVQIQGIIDFILKHLPDGALKTKLLTQIGGK